MYAIQTVLIERPDKFFNFYLFLTTRLIISSQKIVKTNFFKIIKLAPQCVLNALDK